MSAAGYTNRIRTRAEARLTKVQYRFNDASLNTLGAACGIFPNYSVLKYIAKQSCKVPCPELPPAFPVYEGGSAFAGVYDGGFSDSNFNIILEGIPPYSNSFILDGGSSGTVDIGTLYGGTSDSSSGVILDGGNSTPY